MKTVKHTDNTGSERTFMSGVLVLSLSTVIVKIIGLAYKIPLLSILGAEGMGYFNSAYEIFALVCGVSTSGLPVAVSMLISASREVGDGRRVRGIYKTSSAYLITKGVLCSGLLACFAEPLARAIGNPDAYLAILAISPALLFACISGAVRGYFQGCRIMTHTALSQLLEAVGKLIFGVALASLAIFMGLDIPTAAAFGVLGVSLGGLVSATYLLIRKSMENRALAYKKTDSDKLGRHALELLRISLPITLSSALVGSTRIIDMALIMRRLQDIGVSAAESNRIYGSYTTLALPVFMLVPAFIPPITESLIPRLSAAVQSGNKQEQSRAVSNSVRLTVFLACPASMGIVLYSEQILSLIFAGETEAIAISAPLLSALGASVLFSCLVTTTTAILQSYRRVVLPIISLAAGAVVKAVSAYFLIADPRVGVMGAPISTLLSNVTVLALDLIFVSGAAECKLGIMRQLPKPFFASLIAMLASYAVFMPVNELSGGSALAFLPALAVAVLAYFGLCVLLRVVSKEDIAVFGKKRK